MNMSLLVLEITLINMVGKENNCEMNYACKIRWSKKSWCWLPAQFHNFFLCYCHWVPVELHPSLVLNLGELGEFHTGWWFAFCASGLKGKGMEWKIIVIFLYTEIPQSLSLPMEALDTFIWVLLSKKLPQNTEMPTALEKAEKTERYGKGHAQLLDNGMWEKGNPVISLVISSVIFLSRIQWPPI